MIITKNLGLKKYLLLLILGIVGFLLIGFTSNQKISAQSPEMAAFVSLTADPVAIQTGQSTTLTLISQNATSCTIDNTNWPSGQTSGSVVVTPLSSTTYTAQCFGNYRNGPTAISQAIIYVQNNTNICEHAAPPSGCSWQGPETYPSCGATLVCQQPTNICEHAAPPSGCYWKGPETYPSCSATLVCDSAVQKTISSSNQEFLLSESSTPTNLSSEVQAQINSIKKKLVTLIALLKLVLQLESMTGIN